MIHLFGSFESDCMGILTDAGMDIDRIDLTTTNQDCMFHLCISHITGHRHFISSHYLTEIVEKLKFYADPWLQYKED